MASIDRQLKVLPDKPGVYVILDENDEVIYVGKAKSLADRVKTHFTPSNDFSKSRVIRERGAEIKVHEVKTENEALLLEYNMIQEHQPMLNERWKDGKTYPYLRVTTSEKFPRFVLTRERDNEDDIYLGPYSNVGAVKRTLRYVLKLFPVADCKNEIHLGDADGWAKTCIRRRTKQCMRPCEIEVDQEEYKENVDQVIKFMEGKLPEVAEEVERKMEKASDNLEFEEAAKFRDILKSINRTMQRQHVFLEGVDDCYVLVDVSNKHETCISLQKIEDGRVVRRDSNTVDNMTIDNLVDVISSFIITILDLGGGKSLDQPRIIVNTSKQEAVKERLANLGFQPEEAESEVDKQLVDMNTNHAKRMLQRQMLIRKDKGLPSSRVDDLQDMLDLDAPPFVIDCFDVSTLMGTNNVAACVRFEDGKPLKKGYRRFKIKDVDQQDDFASMAEAVYRRYRDVEEGYDPKGLPEPDLIVIDGGPEQLKSAKASIDELNHDFPIIGLAKEEEEIYFPSSNEPIKEDDDRPGLLLLRACRDEAHRFAVKYQRKLRQREGLTTILEEVHGIGPKRRKKLLKKYRTVANIAKESSETLSKEAGIPQKIASDVITTCREFTTRENDYFTRKRG